MNPFRFSLLGLAGATAAIAMCCAVLVYASPLTAGVVWSLTILVLLFGLLSALLVAASPRRGFWVGFALCGWMYVLIMFGPLSGLSALLPVNLLLNHAADALPQAKSQTQVTLADGQILALETIPGQQVVAGQRLVTLTDGSISLRPSAPVRNDEFVKSFVRVSHALLALFLALIGGVTGRILRRSHCQPSPTK